MDGWMDGWMEGWMDLNSWLLSKMTFVATADLLTTSEIEISELGLTNYNYELKLETILKKA